MMVHFFRLHVTRSSLRERQKGLGIHQTVRGRRICRVIDRGPTELLFSSIHRDHELLTRSAMNDNNMCRAIRDVALRQPMYFS